MAGRGRPPATEAQSQRRQAERSLMGQAVRIVRQRLGDLTQAELAARLGVDVQTVSRWERGLRLPSEPLRAQLLAMIQSKGAPQD